MYWIDVLGNISTTASILAVPFVIAAAVAIGFMVTTRFDEDAKEVYSTFKKWAKSLSVCTILLIGVAVFTPSTKSMYLICGVGGTIDYLKENETAKQLPDKVVMALDKWVDSQIEDENKDKDK